MGERGERKVRSDKKVDVKPTISVELKQLLVTFSFLVNAPVKDTGSLLCFQCSESSVVIDSLVRHFRRNYRYHNTLVIGYLNRPKLKIVAGRGSGTDTDKVTLKFKQHEFEQIKALAYGLDITHTSTCALLLKFALTNKSFIESHIDSWLLGRAEYAVRDLLGLGMVQK